MLAIASFPKSSCVVSLFLGDGWCGSNDWAVGKGQAVGVSAVGESTGGESTVVAKGNWAVGKSSWGTSVGNSGQWGSLDGLNGHWGSHWGCCVGHGVVGNWCGHGVVGVDSLGEGAGLEEGLLVSGVGGHWADNSLLPEDWLLCEDGLGHVLGGDDGSRLDGPDGGRGVDVGGLSHWDLAGGQLWGHPGEGVSLGGGVGEVAAEPVALNGSRVVGGCTHQGGCWHHWSWDGGNDGAGSGGSQGGKDSNEGLHFRLSWEKMPFG